jgi:hypothetical protein
MKKAIGSVLFGGVALAAALLCAPPRAAAAPCMTSDVSLTINGTTYTPTSCQDNIAQGGGTTAETNALQTAFGLTGYSYLDKSDDPSTPAGLGGITFQVSAPETNSGTWTVSWTDVAGAPNLPAIVNLIVGLFGGNNGAGYLLENVLLPITPNSGTGLFDINFTNRGGQEPDLSHLLLAGAFVSSPTGVPEPISMALLGAGLLGLAAFGRRRSRVAT